MTIDIAPDVVGYGDQLNATASVIVASDGVDAVPVEFAMGHVLHGR